MWRSNCEGHAILKENIHICNSSGPGAVRSVLHRVVFWASWVRSRRSSCQLELAALLGSHLGLLLPSPWEAVAQSAFDLASAHRKTKMVVGDGICVPDPNYISYEGHGAKTQITDRGVCVSLTMWNQALGIVLTSEEGRKQPFTAIDLYNIFPLIT